MELYIDPIRFDRNQKNGRFLKGHKIRATPRKWSEYMKPETQEICKKNLLKGNPNLGGTNSKRVVAISDGQFLGAFKSIHAASEQTGVCNRSIKHVLSCQRKSAGGCVWFYESDEEKWLNLIK